MINVVVWIFGSMISLNFTHSMCVHHESQIVMIIVMITRRLVIVATTLIPPSPLVGVGEQDRPLRLATSSPTLAGAG